ncbi:MAG: cytochrome c oxidase assembly factor 1 family protein [Acidobacteriota bacterium]|nr:cytochrome c oxidase assembly factor 1 family protein [Acidobacteriota bacterium]MDH3531193.1 cytochrome c oxidase assembly factor 1 family protein [Acidobacteriota bacterium]
MTPDHPAKKSNKKIYLIIGLVVIVPIILTVGLIVVIVGALLVGSKSTYEYKCAIAEVKKDQKAIEMLGEPIEEGFYLVPNIEINGPRREVNFFTPVSGPKGSGTLTVSSYRDAFRSDFLMQLEKDGETEVLHKGTYPCEE